MRRPARTAPSRSPTGCCRCCWSVCRGRRTPGRRWRRARRAAPPATSAPCSGVNVQSTPSTTRRVSPLASGRPKARSAVADGEQHAGVARRVGIDRPAEGVLHVRDAGVGVGWRRRVSRSSGDGPAARRSGTRSDQIRNTSKVSWNPIATQRSGRAVASTARVHDAGPPWRSRGTPAARRARRRGWSAAACRAGSGPGRGGSGRRASSRPARPARRRRAPATARSSTTRRRPARRR